MAQNIPGTFQRRSLSSVQSCTWLAIDSGLEYVAVSSAFVHLLPENLDSSLAAPLLCGKFAKEIVT